MTPSGVLWTDSVSIHAPVKGATKIILSRQAMSGCFNPRAREGRDFSSLLTTGIFSSFNPRAREGRDLNSMSRVTGHSKFQSTRP